jgi:hypothetical protein
MKCEVNASQNVIGKYNGKNQPQINPAMCTADIRNFCLSYFKSRLCANGSHAATFVSSLRGESNKRKPETNRAKLDSQA